MDVDRAPPVLDKIIMKIRVAFAEDNNFLAISIKEKLKLFDEIEYKFNAVNGIDLLHKLSLDNEVDVILMDIEMPKMNGLEATEHVHEKYPDIKIIILTVFDDEEKIFKAVQSGAMGYLLKEETPDKIYEGIKIVMEGGATMSPMIAAKALSMMKNPHPIKVDKETESFSLSAREISVLENLGKGLNYNEIALILFISPVTVRKHIENIYRKLQVNNKVQAILKATKYRII